MLNSKTKIFNFIKDEIIQRQNDKPFIIAIDGVDGSGKSFFAKELIDYLRENGLDVIHSSIDFFHNPRQKRYSEGKPTYLSFFEDSFNYPILIESLLTPLKTKENGRIQTKHFDHKTDTNKIVNESFDKNTILVFDGIFSHRDEVIHFWDISLYLDVTFEESYKRMAKRDSCPPNPENQENERYYKGQKYYLEKYNPKSRATIIINNNNYNQPFEIKDE